MMQIDYKSGILLAAATVPGAILGALTTDYIPRRLFDAGFGILLIGASVYLFLNRITEAQTQKRNQHHLVINHVEKNGTANVYSYNLKLGSGLSFIVGYVSSLLGIGGGIIHVPALVHLLNFPVHIATATSHFMLAIMALTGTIVHLLSGSFSRGAFLTIDLAIGVIIGAQLGALLSDRLHGALIIRSLAVALAFVGLRIIIAAF